MARATDDERRRVADRLRRLNAPSLIALMSILGVGGRDMCDRLADLIEPKGIESEAFKLVESDGFDREALLALADELDEKAESGGYFLVSPTLRESARRIREACGVVA